MYYVSYAIMTTFNTDRWSCSEIVLCENPELQTFEAACIVYINTNKTSNAFCVHLHVKVNFRYHFSRPFFSRTVQNFMGIIAE